MACFSDEELAANLMGRAHDPADLWADRRFLRANECANRRCRELCETIFVCPYHDTFINVTRCQWTLGIDSADIIDSYMPKAERGS